MELATPLENHIEKIEEPSAEKLGPDLAFIFNYWKKLCDGQQLPKWQSWDWQEVPSHIIPWCAVVDVRQFPKDFVIRFWGTGRIRIHGKDYTGESVSSIEPAEAAIKAFAEYYEVAVSGAPVFRIRTGLGKSSDRIYKILRVPFGSQQRTDQILSTGTCFDEDIPKEQSASSLYSNFPPLE